MKLTSIEEIVKIGVKFKFDWFRGHSKCYNDLTPRIFRKEFKHEGSFFPKENIEHHIVADFKRIAPSLENKLPGVKEHLNWLIYMQHFGTPTRLLDWTESIFIAAYFACISNENEDGELWRMYPQALNMISIGSEVFPIIPSRHLNFLASEALHNSPQELANELGLLKIIDKPIAFYPTKTFPRMTLQQSTFTIHPQPNEGNSIKEILSLEKRFLRRYLIPKENKQKILLDLISLGYNNKTLFQNLDNLSSDLIRKYMNPAWNIWGQPPEEE